MTTLQMACRGRKDSQDAVNRRLAGVVVRKARMLVPDGVGHVKTAWAPEAAATFGGLPPAVEQASRGIRTMGAPARDAIPLPFAQNITHSAIAHELYGFPLFPLVTDPSSHVYLQCCLEVVLEKN